MTVGDHDVLAGEEAGAQPLEVRVARHVDAADAADDGLDLRPYGLEVLPELRRLHEIAFLNQDRGTPCQQNDRLEPFLLPRRNVVAAELDLLHRLDAFLDLRGALLGDRTPDGRGLGDG